jgi:hypothetical protein
VSDKLISALVPKSICTCGHLGDGEGSAHAGPIGHGRCLVPGCGCTKFTWLRFTEQGEQLIEEARKLKEHK